MGSLAGGEQSATQPLALLHVAKSPPDPDEELEELVVVPELEDPVVDPEVLELVVVPELVAEPPAPPVLPELVVEPPAPRMVPVLPVPVLLPEGSPPVLPQAVKRGTRAAKAA
jgi:hypothetical protein